MMKERPNNFEPTVRNFVKDAKDVGFSKEERRELFDKATNNPKARNILANKSDDAIEGGLLMQNVYRKTITDFLSMLGNGTGDQREMVALGSTLREYGSRGEGGYVLSEKEIKLVSLGVKYFERWFYEGGLVQDVHVEENGQSPLAASTFLVNQIAKIKEQRAYRGVVADFEKGHLNQFLSEVEAAANDVFSEKQLAVINGRLQEKQREADRLRGQYKIAENASRPFFADIQKAESEVLKEVARINSTLDEFAKNAEPAHAQALQRVSAFLKDVSERNRQDLVRQLTSWKRPLLEGACKAAELNDERSRSTVKREESAITKAFRRDLALLSAAFPKPVPDETAASKPKPQRLSGLAALANLSNEMKSQMSSPQTVGRVLDEIATKTYNREAGAINEAVQKIRGTRYYDLEGESKATEWDPERMRLFDFKNARARAMKDFPASLEAIRKSLSEPAGDMYFLKTCLIAANESRLLNGKLDEAHHIPNIQSPQGGGYATLHRSENGGRPVYDFSGNNMAAYDKVHMEPAHYIFCQIVVEYLWKKNRVG